MIVRVPHSPQDGTKSIWSLALWWNPSTGGTKALFDGVSNEQRDNFIGYLSAMQAQHDHPFLLPMMLLDHLREFYVEYRNRNEMRLHRLETELRMTRGETQPGADDQEYWGRGLQANTIKTNQLLTSLIYLERRINFLGNLANNLASNLDIVNTFDMSAEQKTRLTAQSLEMKAHIKTISSLATDQANQVTCLQKRAQALLNVVSIPRSNAKLMTDFFADIHPDHPTRHSYEHPNRKKCEARQLIHDHHCNLDDVLPAWNVHFGKHPYTF